jgi:hypothetical protein
MSGHGRWAEVAASSSECFDVMRRGLVPSVENSDGFTSFSWHSFYKFKEKFKTVAPERMLTTTACAALQPESGFHGVFGHPRKIFGGKMPVRLEVECRPNKNPDLSSQVGVVVLVAGAGFEPTTFGL